MLQKIFGSLLIGKSGLSLAQLDEEQRRAIATVAASFVE